MFWEGHQESLTVQFLQFIDWKTKDPPPPQIIDALLRVVGTVDIVGLHLLTHILKEYYFEMCHTLTLQLNLDLQSILNGDQNQQQQNDNNNNSENRKKAISESVLIVTKLCSVICKMPNLESLHLSLSNFPQQCYRPCIQMFNLGIKSKTQTEADKDKESKQPEDNHGYLFSGGNDVFPSLQQIVLDSSIFYVSEENDDFITATPISDFNTNENITSGYWSDGNDENESKNDINIQQLMTDYNIAASSSPTAGAPIAGNNPNTNEMHTWQCNTCTLINNHQFMECSACGEPRQIGTGSNNISNAFGSTPQNEALLKGGNVYDDDDMDDEKLLTLEDDDQKSAYYPFLSFLKHHQRLKSVSLHIGKGGKNGISLVNRILLSIAKRKHSLDSFYLDCNALHLNYCVKYLTVCIKQHSFQRFSINFFAIDELSVMRLIDAFNQRPHERLLFFSIHGSGSQPANQSILGLIKFVQSHRELEYLKLSYFTGIAYLYNNQNWTQFMHSLLSLQSLCYVAFGEILVDDNDIMHHLCQFVQQCTTLQSIDLCISQKSYEGVGGSLENTKKFIFYTFKNQIFLQNQIEEAEGCLEVCWKMPFEIIDLVVGFAFDLRGAFNVNISGLPEADMYDVGNQFIKLKQTQSRNWRIARDLQLFTHL